MTRVGETAGVDPLVEGRRDLGVDRNPTEWHVPRVDTLRERDQVRDHVPDVHGEPLAATAEASHDLVRDHDDAMCVAQCTYSRQVAVRRHQDAVRADDGLQHDRCDVVSALEHDDLGQVGERSLALLFRGVRPERGAVRVRAEELDDAGNDTRLRGPPTRVTGQTDRTPRRAVITAVHRQHLLATGVQARHAHRVLGRLGTAVGEEDLVQVPGCALRDQTGCFGAGRGGGTRCDGGERRGLLLDGGDHLGVLVADVQVDELRGEVEVAGAVLVPEGRALATGDDHRRDQRLRGPRVEHVCPVVQVGRAGAGVVGHRSTSSRRQVGAGRGRSGQVG